LEFDANGVFFGRQYFESMVMHDLIAVALPNKFWLNGMRPALRSSTKHSDVIRAVACISTH
jgi:hypothetical protein